MARYLAGHREPREVVREVVNIDYADVLRQAVDNERWRVLRQVREATERIPSSKSSSTSSYRTDNRTGAEVKSDVLAALDRIASEVQP